MVHSFFFSPTGTSAKIAAAVAAGVAGGAPVATCDLTHAAARNVLPPADVAVIAVPVYGGHPAPTALERLRDLRGNGTAAVAVALYGNRAFEAAAAELAAFLTGRGFVCVAAGAFVGEHSYSAPATPIAAGRPDAADLASAKRFGEAVRQKLSAAGIAAEDAAPASDPAHNVAKAMNTAGEPTVAGDSAGTNAAGITATGCPTELAVDVKRLKDIRTPLWPMLRFIRLVLRIRRSGWKPGVPECDAALCTRCGRCAGLCPTEAIPHKDPLRSDPARCIRCNACVKGCPFGARSYQTPFAAALAKNFRKRKEGKWIM